MATCIDCQHTLIAGKKHGRRCYTCYAKRQRAQRQSRNNKPIPPISAYQARLTSLRVAPEGKDGQPDNEAAVTLSPKDVERTIAKIESKQAEIKTCRDIIHMATETQHIMVADLKRLDRLLDDPSQPIPTAFTARINDCAALYNDLLTTLLKQPHMAHRITVLPPEPPIADLTPTPT